MSVISDMLYRLGNCFNFSILNKEEFKNLYEKDDQKAIEEDWKAVGDTMKSVLYGDKYER